MDFNWHEGNTIVIPSPNNPFRVPARNPVSGAGHPESEYHGPDWEWWGLFLCGRVPIVRVTATGGKAQYWTGPSLISILDLFRGVGIQEAEVVPSVPEGVCLHVLG